MTYAIVQSGPRQLRAEAGAVLEVDRIDAEIGASVALPVVLLADGDSVQVGAPYVDGVSVNTTIVDHVRGPKIRVFKYKPKVRYRKRIGHRQALTLLQVDSIGDQPQTSEKAAAPAKVKPAKAKAEPVAESVPADDPIESEGQEE